MSLRPVRILHSGQFRLERPLSGFTEIPESARTALVDAPYRAAERVFDAALTAGVDALALCGDLLDVAWTGPRGPRFLVDQFERLASRGIDVWWATGAIDSAESWPISVPLPPNVHRFRADRPEEIVLRRDGLVRARVIGLSGGARHARLDEFRPSGSDGVVMTMTPGMIDLSPEALRGIHYIAVGSRIERATLQTTPCPVHDAGSPQGRSPEESGPHGATLIDLAIGSPARLQFIATDVARYLSARVTLEPGMTRELLQRQLSAKLDELALAHSGVDLLASFTIGGRGSLMTSLRRGPLDEELTSTLRRLYGRSSPVAWTLSLTALPELTMSDEVLDQDSLLGEFLRTVERQLQAERPSEEFWDLTTSLLGPDAQPFDDDLVPWLRASEPARRRDLLRESAVLGTDLLTGERGS